MNKVEAYIQRMKRTIFSPSIHSDPFFRGNREEEEDISEEDITEILTNDLPIDHIVTADDRTK